MAKRVAHMVIAVFFICSFSGPVLASLNTEGQTNSVAGKPMPQLHCGLALPLDEGQGEEGDETEGSEEDTQDGSESESETQTENQPNR